MATYLLYLLVAFLVARLVWSIATDWQGAKARFGYLFGPTPRDWRQSAAWLCFIFGGPLLEIFAIDHYPLLDIRALWVAAVLLVVLFPISFYVIKKSVFPANTPKWARIVAHAAFTMCGVAWILGFVMVVNGYSTPLSTRSVQVVRKEESRQRDPSRRQYRLYVVVWPGSNVITQIDSSGAVYNAVRVGDRVMVRLGEGRLGLEWVHDVEP
jgi:hypothetical protein